MRIFTPNEIAKPTGTKYLGVLVAAKFARFLNDFPGDADVKEKKLTTRALEELAQGNIEFSIARHRRIEQ